LLLVPYIRHLSRALEEKAGNVKIFPHPRQFLLHKITFRPLNCKKRTRSERWFIWSIPTYRVEEEYIWRNITKVGQIFCGFCSLRYYLMFSWNNVWRVKYEEQKAVSVL
jgi:hypothetical protein